MTIRLAHFFFLLSLLLIFSNRFGFLLFFWEDGRIRKIFGNAMGKELYNPRNGTQLRNPEDMVPPGTVRTERVHSSVNYIVQRLTVRRGAAFQYFEEITVKFQDAAAAANTDLILKISFVEAFSLRMT